MTASLPDELGQSCCLATQCHSAGLEGNRGGCPQTVMGMCLPKSWERKEGSLSGGSGLDGHLN